MKIALCMLTLNELEGCKHDIPIIKKLNKHFTRIFVVDNGSTDGTIDYLKKQNVEVYYKKGISYNDMHILAVKKCKTDAIVFFHPKGTIPVKDTLKFRKYFEDGYDFIVANRIMKGAVNEENRKLLKPRKWMTIFLAIISALIWRTEGNVVWDVFHGFRGLTVDAFKKINPEKNERTIDIEEVVESYKKTIKRIEFPTKEKSRKSGKTHFKTIPFGIEIIRFFLRKYLFTFTPKHTL